MIKLIAMDLDGTLFDSDHKTISERNIKAIKTASSKGIKIAICSGRTCCHIKNVLEQLKVVDYILVSNGALAMDITGNVMASDCMNYDTWKFVYEFLEQFGIVTEIYCNGNSYMKKSSSDLYKSDYLKDEFLKELKDEITFCDNPTETLNNKAAEKVTSIYVPKDKYDRIKTTFIEKNLAVTSSIPFNMEINKVGVNKGKGLSSLCNILGINASEVMAFGDGNNDIQMLEWAEQSYAMKNAQDDVKKAAKLIADYNYKDGIAKAIEGVLL